MLRYTITDEEYLEMSRYLLERRRGEPKKAVPKLLLKTVVQMLMVILMIGNFGGFLAALTQVFKWAALLLTLISLATYLFQNRKVLNEEV